jgi:cytochrome P450
MRTWMVADPEKIVELLRRPDIAMPSLDDLIGHIEKRRGIELKALRQAARYIPVMHTGDRHAELRRALAVYLARKAAQSEAVLPEIMQRALKPLERKGTVDIYQEVVAPLMAEFTGLLVGVQVPREILELRLFLILTHRKSPSFIADLDRRFAAAIEFLKPHCEDDTDLGCKICCLTFGYETLTMMLVESILRIVETSLGAVCQLPVYPPETGVPITWRQATRDTTIAGCPVHTRDSIMFALQAATYSEKPAYKNVLFGIGLHSCVGKQVSLMLWEELARQFNRLQISAKLGAYQTTSEPYMIQYKKAEIDIQ